ncbi:septum formation inhibitor MinC [Aristophania vespae]|uniref:Probable septum site-determining protein MinC n=2 Tax=Aristophania vespae TaxID=2697033 RepID=A0A6P1NCN6_9PROT|nr:septum site-determining protein MinC [Aristophania vespae]QHI96415.1 septum formation inhibitor MinC [Aristophania vespae]
MSHSSAPHPNKNTPEALRIRARGRSFLALVLTPEAPLDAWLKGLDIQISHSVNFFNGRPIIIDLELLDPQTEGLSSFLAALKERKIHIIGIEGADPSWPALAGWEWPAALNGGRPSGAVTLPDSPSQKNSPESESIEQNSYSPDTIIINRPVRSGQTIENLNGNIIIIGGVSSGAEVIAGGFIHIYGTLRGRAIAGINHRPHAQIFTTRLEAELLAIDGYYLVAEEINDACLGHPAQICLKDGKVCVLPLPSIRPSETNG